MDSCWQVAIPVEIVSEIFRYLSRPDRLACSVVCQKWHNALSRRYLWKRIVLHVDRDFLEPSTTLFVREYCKCIRTLEIGWNRPLVQNRWLPLKVHDLTKRVIHFICVLYENNIQLSCFRFFEWHDIYAFKKIIFHVSRFLKTQSNLKKLIFHNINLPRTECMRVLESCLGSKFSVTSLEIHNNYYNFNTAFATLEFVVFLEEFLNLSELKLDYFILSRPRVMDVIAENCSTKLKFLEIYVDEIDLHSIIIPEKQWKRLRKACPDIKVSIKIKNICHYEQIKFIFLMKAIPLNYFTLISNNKFNQKVSRNFEATLLRLIRNYHDTLERINLDLKNNRENLDHVIFSMILKCPKLKKLYFDGILNDNMHLFYEICQYKKSAKGILMKIFPNKYKSVTNVVHMFS
ncbi:F-box only protein 39-like [Diabrotica undecimpunctata]|uniref:F-box only protein 39-like n=1 Tax=Diabrotica undecimpunctata TaxID=50387 RepID=UPI003B6405BD